MLTVDIRDAETNLSKLVDRAANGESFIITKAGKPLVRVVAVGEAGAPTPRIGFMKGWIAVPENFDDLGREEIERLFSGRP